MAIMAARMKKCVTVVMKNARIVAKSLGYVYVDTGAMYRTLAWYCLQKKVDIDDPKAVSALCRKWKTSLECVDGKVHLKGRYLTDTERETFARAALNQVAEVSS